jgi:RNA 2',3'-cyclic 3'-phosphodiesterase
MRLFIALWPPPEAIDELDAALVGVRSLGPDLRWAPSRQWHLTLTFLGDVVDERRPELAGRLARAATRHAPLRLAFAGGGRFGKRVLFTKVSGDREPLRHLAASTTAAARRAGLAVDDRPYRPHLTLARSRRDVDLRPLATALGSFRGTDWTATQLHLVQSRLGQGASRTAVYETVDAWPLAGRAARM